MEKHYTLSKAAELLGVTTQTLRNWDNAGKIRAIRTPGNQRRIPDSEIARLLSPPVENTEISAQKPMRTKEESQQPLPTVLKNKENHLLMCKDTPVYDITESVILNKSLLPGCILKEIKSFPQWMETRYSKDTNFSSQSLMHSAFGQINHEHAAYATGALSLSDCYWLKQESEDILFADITPYIHKEWDGKGTNGAQNEYIWGSLANLFVSGKTDKRWIDAQTLLKINTFGEIEPYALSLALGMGNIPKALISEEGIKISNFTNPDIFYESIEQFGIVEETKDPRDIAVEMYKEHAVALFVIDYLVENNDRQEDDYGFLRNANTGEYIGMAPYHNFDWIWSGETITLPKSALQDYRDYIHSICRRAINIAPTFEYGTIIEARARELLQI